MITTDTDTDVRALATIETITSVEPIDGADNIEAVRVRGWKVAVRITDNFQVGDQCVYVEVDTLVPIHDARFAFLAGSGVETMTNANGTTSTGHVLKTAKRRSMYSQGLVVAFAEFPEFAGLPAGTDVTSLLGMQVFEEDIPIEMLDASCGAFPTRFAPVTKAERAQNLGDVWSYLASNGLWVATEKIDGESVTIINDGGTLRACGRKWEYKPGYTRIWELAERYKFAELMSDGMVIQAEMFGEGAPKNPLKVKGLHLAIFNVLIDGRPIGRDNWPEWALGLATAEYDFEFPSGPDAALEQVDRLASKVNASRPAEGIVWHERTGRTYSELCGRGTIKVIGPRYLLKNDR